MRENLIAFFFPTSHWTGRENSQEACYIVPSSYLLSGTAQDAVLSPCLQAQISFAYLVFCPKIPLSPSPQCCSLFTHYLACIHVWDCPNPDAGPCSWPCWTLQALHGSISRASLPYSMLTTQFVVVCKTCWECTQSYHPDKSVDLAFTLCWNFHILCRSINKYLPRKSEIFF